MKKLSDILCQELIDKYEAENAQLITRKELIKKPLYIAEVDMIISYNNKFIKELKSIIDHDNRPIVTVKPEALVKRSDQILKASSKVDVVTETILNNPEEKEEEHPQVLQDMCKSLPPVCKKLKGDCKTCVHKIEGIRMFTFCILDHLKYEKK